MKKADGPQCRSGEYAVINGNVQAKWGRNTWTREQIDEIVDSHMVESTYRCKRSIMSKWAHNIGDVFDWWVEANPELYYDVEGSFTNQGDGIQLGMWAGAQVQQSHAPMIHHMGGGADLSGVGVMESGSERQALHERGPARPAAGKPDRAAEEPRELADLRLRQLAPAAAPIMQPWPSPRWKSWWQRSTPMTPLLSRPRWSPSSATTSWPRTATTRTSTSPHPAWALENGPFYADKFTTALLLVCIGGLESDENSPIVDEVAEERTDVKVGKVNVDEQPELAGQFGVMSIPTLLVFEQGKLVRQAVGARPKAGVLDLLG